MVGRAVPRRRPVGERVGVAGGPAALQLALLVAHLVPQPEARAHQLAQHRRERAVAPVGDLAEQRRPAVEHPPAPPARGGEDRGQRRAELVEDRRPERHVEVAHAVEVSDGTAAAAVVLGARGRPPGDLLEHAVERVERRGDLLALRRGHRVARGLEAVEPGGVGEQRAQVALGERGHRQRRGDARRRGDRLDRPRLEVHDALALERARAHADRVAFLGERAPRERPEEPDRVVLGAVALPVVADHVDPAAPARRAAGRTRGELVDRARQRLPALPRHRLAERRIARDLGEPRVLVGAEAVEPLDREARAADREVGPQAPLVGER